MKKKRQSILIPLSKCCLKRFYDLDLIAKYGSIFIITFILLSQIFNILIGQDIKTSLFSVIINLFFLVAILTKVEMIKVTILEEQLDNILKVIIFVLLLNFLGYMVSSEEIHNYIFAPISFFGAYLVFILLKTK
jgi:hypothetical protein